MDAVVLSTSVFCFFFGMKVGHGKIKSGLRMTGEELMGQLRVSV